jgi:lysophospholipase L1-like esterase
MKSYVAFGLLLISMEISGQSLPETRPVKFLALGDSYTIGESVAEDQRWPHQLVKALAGKGYQCEKPFILATTGWRTDDLAKAIDRKNIPKNFDLVSLLIGVNDQYQGRTAKVYATAFEPLLKIAIRFADNDPSKVIVISIPDYGFTPFGKNNQKKITLEIDSFNAANKSISQKWKVRYINITDISRKAIEDPQLIAADGLHPSGKMYALWVKNILETITPTSTH